VGYGELVEKELGVVLDKGHGRTDWTKRPLSDQQFRYALDDVIYLGRLYTRMRGKLEGLERLDWLDEEFGLLEEPATYVVEPRLAWRKVKGRNRLRGGQLAVLRELAAWREEQARERDRPRKWILKDEVMLDMARRTPQNEAGLTAIRGFDGGMLARHGKILLALIEAGRTLPKAEWPQEKLPPVRLSENQLAQADLLAAALRLIGEQRAINGAAIASRKDLERLVGGERDLPLLKGWRKGIAGGLLLELLEGKRDLRIRDGVLDLQEWG
jgi:ribonuclease D